MRIVGRIDKRTKTRALGAAAWGDVDTGRGRSGHPLVSAKHQAAADRSVRRTRRCHRGHDSAHSSSAATATYLLSNNHVLAKEGRRSAGDRILQRATTTAGSSRPSASHDCASGSS